MTNSKGAVVVGLDRITDDTASMVAALDLAAREAVRRHVDLRLVYGRQTLPSFALTCQIVERMVTRTTRMHPGLAMTTAVYPGTAVDALLAAAPNASLVVIAAQTRLDGSDVIASLVATTTITRAAVIVVVTPTPTIPDEPAMLRREPMLAH